MESTMMNSTPTSVTSTSTDPWSQKSPCSGPDHHDFSSSFLQHASGQGISGVCVWAAILITCHQVGISFVLFLCFLTYVETVLFRIVKISVVGQTLNNFPQNLFSYIALSHYAIWLYAHYPRNTSSSFTLKLQIVFFSFWLFAQKEV